MADCGDTMRADCAQVLATHTAVLTSMAEDVKATRMAVLGNGNVEKGLSHRVLVLERTDSRRDRRYWVLFGAAVTTLVGLVIKAFC